MSRAFTSRPTVTSNRGRGTRQNTLNQRVPQETQQNQLGARAREPINTGARGAGPPGGRGAEMAYQGQDTGRRLTHQGAYSVLPPDEQKRQRINETAQRETEGYEAYKQQHTPKSFSYVGTAGGGQMTQQQARQKLVQTSPTKTQKLLQNQGRKMTMKQIDEAELQKKKDEQRQKSLVNEERRKQQEEASQTRWDEPRRRANEAFLNRLEKKSNKASGSHVNSQPETSSRSADTSHDRSPGRLSHDHNMAAGWSPDLTPDQRKKVEALVVMFPQYTHRELLEALRLVDFSLDNAVAMME